MKLYFMPRSRLTRPRWLLEEIGVPYELVRLDPAQQAQVHPSGEIPALVDGDVTLLEPSALCLIYLADRFPEKNLAPPLGSPERGQYYRWMAFAEQSLEPMVMKLYRHAQLPEEQKPSAQQQEEIAKVRPRLEAALDVVDAWLKDREVLVGGHFTAADVMMAALLHLAHHTQKLLDGHPRLMEYVMRHTRRPASRQAVS